MLHYTDKIENVEGSIAHAQDVLDNAQRVLSAVDAAQAKTDEVHSAVRRLFVGIAVASVAFAIFVAARQRRA